MAAADLMPDAQAIAGWATIIASGLVHTYQLLAKVGGLRGIWRVVLGPKTPPET